jgi:hypothetical protein
MGLRGAYRLALAAALLGPAVAFASSGGITGQSTAGCTLGGCHGDAPGTFNYTAFVQWESSPGSGVWSSATTTIARNAALSIRYFLDYNSGTVATRGGFDMTANGGTLTEADGTIQNISGELTHTTPRTLTGNDVIFNNITWTAPNASGTFTLSACGQAVNFNGLVSGDGPHDCDTLAITVNNPPVISNVANQVINEDGTTGALAFTVSDTETAATSLGVTRSSSNTTLVPLANVVLGGSGSNRTVTVTPAANQSGSTTITLTVTDGNSQTDTDTFTVTVNAVNDAPDLGGTINNVASYTENGAAVTVDGAVTVTDVDSANLNLATVSITGNFQSAQDSLVCPSPAIPGISCSYSSGTGVLTLSGSATLANYELALEDAGYSNSSDAPSTATRTISVQVRDSSNALSVADTTTLNVTAANDAPVAVDDSATIDEDSSLNVLTVLGNDTDVDPGDTRTVTLVNGAAVSTCPTMTAVSNGSVCKSSSSPDNTLSFTPTPAFVGSTSFTYTMADSAAATSTATVNLTVANVGDPPVAVDDTATVNEDSAGNTLDVLANDTDVDGGDTRTITQVNGGAVATCPSTTAVTNGTVCRSSASPNNTLSFTPTADVAGNSAFSYTVQDSATLTDVGSVSVTITNVADAPVAVADGQAVAEDAAAVGLDVLANDTDADQSSGPGDTRRIVSVGAPSAGGQVSIVGAGVNNTLSYDSAPHFFGTETFGYTMEDSTGLQSSAVVTMTLTAVNDAPQITSSPVTVAQDAVPYAYPVTVSDVDDANDGAQLDWSLLVAPAGMTVSATGLIEWTPPPDTAGGFDVTVRVADGGEDGAAPATQSFTLNVSVPDSDGDGMPDSFENANGFDPNDPGDADQDADGDGRTNREEYEQGSDPNLDDIAPQVTAPADLVVASTGYLTVVDIGAASAADGLDGALTATSDLASTALRPGRYTVTWTASDAAGNAGSDIQQVDVLPLAEFSADQAVDGDGGSAIVTVTLNGSPPEYPVLIQYAEGGTTPGPGGTLQIDSGTVGVLGFSFSGAPAGVVTLTMTGASQAAIGIRRTHTLTVVNGNIGPQVTLGAAQGALPRLVAYQADGPMTLTAEAFDANADPLAIDWSASADALGIDGEATAQASFDPSGLAPGAYPVRVTVSDGQSPASASLLVLVATGSSADVDIDADGIPDSVDSVTDYPALLEDQAGDPATAAWLETEPTLSLRRGRTSLAADRSGALIAMGDIVTFGVGEGGIALGADSFDNVGGIFDFEVHGLAPGGTARVVLPLQVGIRAGSVYRKFDPVSGWHDFVVDADNAVASAFPTLGQCPGPASADYVDGLRPFARCVRLTLEDGGPNDADAVADGVIRDPGGVAIVNAEEAAAASVGSGAFLAVLCLPLALLLRLRRRRGAALLALAALLGAPAAQAEHHIRVHYTGDVATGFDDNVTNAQHDADIRESGFASVTGNVDYQRQLSLYTTLLLRGSGQYEHWNSFEGLSNARGTAMARLLYRADGDFATPTLAAWVSAAVWEFDSEIRDSNEYRAGVFATRHLTTQLMGRAALSASRRQSDGEVFDLSGWSAQLNLDWAAAPRATAYAGYQYYAGGVTSTATPSLWIGLAAEAIEADDAFGGLAGGLRAYRLDATAHIGTLGFNYAFTRKLSADVQGQYITTRADARNEYRRMVGVVSLLARF